MHGTGDDSDDSGVYTYVQVNSSRRSNRVRLSVSFSPALSLYSTHDQYRDSVLPRSGVWGSEEGLLPFLFCGADEFGVQDNFGRHRVRRVVSGVHLPSFLVSFSMLIRSSGPFAAEAHVDTADPLAGHSAARGV